MPPTALHILQIAAGGALGALARYGLAGLVQRHAGPAFPAGTFAVNVLGCLLFGLVAGLATDRAALPPSTRPFVLIGLLGGFTTFSTYAYETFELLREGDLLGALANGLGQVLAGLLALWLGLAVASWFGDCGRVPPSS